MRRHSTTVSMPRTRWRTALASGLLTLLALWPGRRGGAAVCASLCAGSGGWYALYGPAKLPADIVARYNDATRKALAGDDLKNRLVEQGYDLWTGSAQLLAERAARELAMWATVTKGIVAE